VRGGKSAAAARPPFLDGCYLVRERVPPEPAFPFDLACVRDLDLTFESPVTFFVGENGTGKSTVLEAIAETSGFPPGGGAREDAPDGPRAASTQLARAMRPRFRVRPRRGFFFRAEMLAGFADTLERRDADPDFLDDLGGRADPFALYGGKSLHARSHGEAFLAVLEARVKSGLFFFDEPEAALSPQRQLAFLAFLDETVARGDCQVIAATHSPLLLTFPGARILSFDDGPPRPVEIEDTSHWKLTRAVLADRARFWKALREDGDPAP
jgi:predicted ATPase